MSVQVRPAPSSSTDPVSSEDLLKQQRLFLINGRRVKVHMGVNLGVFALNRDASPSGVKHHPHFRE